MSYSIKQLICAIFFAAILAGCNEDKDTNTPETAVIGKRAPDIAALDEHGELVELPQDSDKPLILNFWSTGCGVCIVELRGLSEYLAEHPDAFELIAINITSSDDLSELVPLMRQKGITMPLSIDQFNISRDRYNVSVTPYSYLIGEDNIILARHIGLLKPEHVPDWLNSKPPTDVAEPQT